MRLEEFLTGVHFLVFKFAVLGGDGSVKEVILVVRLGLFLVGKEWLGRRIFLLALTQIIAVSDGYHLSLHS